jgi:hypothetical protein
MEMATDVERRKEKTMTTLYLPVFPTHIRDWQEVLTAARGEVARTGTLLPLLMEKLSDV